MHINMTNTPFYKASRATDHKVLEVGSLREYRTFLLPTISIQGSFVPDNVVLGRIAVLLHSYGYKVNALVMQRITTHCSTTLSAIALLRSFQETLETVHGDEFSHTAHWRKYPLDNTNTRNGDKWFSRMVTSFLEQEWDDSDGPDPLIAEADLSAALGNVTIDKTIDLMLTSQLLDCVNVSLQSKALPSEDVVLMAMHFDKCNYLDAHKLKTNTRQGLALRNVLCYDSNNLVFHHLTDILRYFHVLSGGRLDMKDTVSYSVPGKESLRHIATIFMKLVNEDELARNQGKWKNLLQRMHIGTYVGNGHAAGLVNRLRGTGEKLRSYDSMTELLYTLLYKNYEVGNRDKLLDHLHERPKEFFKNIIRMMKRIELRHIVPYLKDGILDKVTIKDLIAFYNRINRKGGDYLVISDSKKPYYRVEKAAEIATDVFKTFILNNIQRRISLSVMDVLGDGKCYYIPLAGRGMKPLLDGNSNKGTIARFSSIELKDLTDRVRFFVEWETPGDLDLSAMLFQANGDTRTLTWENTGTSSSAAIFHSGDNRKGGPGSVEYIDLQVPFLKENNVTYVVITIDVYGTGSKTMNNFQGNHGYMELPAELAGSAYQPDKVTNRTKLGNETSNLVTFILDIVNNSVIMVNMASDNSDGRLNSYTLNKLIPLILSRQSTDLNISDLISTVPGKTSTVFNVNSRELASELFT